MTGLYNRQYFEKEKQRLDREENLPLSIIVVDINGVRLINDAFGHKQGDRLIVETAKLLKTCIRDGDILARIGGDEFGLLLPNTDGDTAFEIIKEMKEACDTYNQRYNNGLYSISLSMGYGTKDSSNEDIDRSEKVAEDYMYNRKLLVRKSSHSAIL